MSNLGHHFFDAYTCNFDCLGHLPVNRISRGKPSSLLCFIFNPIIERLRTVASVALDADGLLYTMVRCSSSFVFGVVVGLKRRLRGVDEHDYD